MDKLVSIILPTYNGGKYIKKAIESIESQTFTNWELLVVDDGSIDDTEDMVISFSQKDRRIIYLKNENNLGIQKTLNKGIKEAKGEYIARIDDDDIWCDKDKLKKQVEFMNTNPKCCLVGTGVIVIDEEGGELMRYLLPETDQEIRNSILSKNCFVHSSVLFKKDIVSRVGGYDESINSRHIEDYDLWLRLGLMGELNNLPLYSVKFTLRAGSISSKNKKEQFKKDLVLAKKFKNKYPNYFGAIVRSYLRILVYGLLLKTPIKSSINRLIKFYKENW